MQWKDKRPTHKPFKRAWGSIIVVEVVCPRCAASFRASPGAEADCPVCGFGGGRVPGDASQHAYTAGMGSYTFQSQGFAAPGAELEKARIKAEERAQKKADEKQFSGLAIASFVLGLLFIIPVGGIVAFALGIGGIAQTGKGRLRGRALAIIGMVLGGLAQIAWFAVIVAGFSILGRLVNGA